MTGHGRILFRAIMTSQLGPAEFQYAAGRLQNKPPRDHTTTNRYNASDNVNLIVLGPAFENQQS